MQSIVDNITSSLMFVAEMKHTNWNYLITSKRRLIFKTFPLHFTDICLHFLKMQIKSLKSQAEIQISFLIVLISLYNSLFASFLQYGIIIWGLTYDIHIKPIYILPKKVVRAIAFMNFTSTSSPISSDLKILKLYDLFHLKLLLFVYESVNRISPSVFHNFFEILSDVHQHDTRQARKGDIFIIRHNTLQYGERSIRYTGAKSWNNTPMNIK